METKSNSINIFTAHPKQEEFFDAVFSGKYNFLTYGGAVGGGKTYVGLMALILLSRFYPGSHWAVIRQDLPVLKRTTIESFKKIVPSNFVINYNQQEQVFTFKNGSQIQFMAENYFNDKDFDQFKGLEVNGFLLEQIEELQEGLLNICFLRSGRWKIDPMPKPIIMATVNPTLTWVKKRIYLSYVNDELPKSWFYLPALISDNPVLYEDENYMAQFENLDPISYKRWIEGNWDAFAVDKPFMYCFNEKDHISVKAVYKERETVYLSFDFNVDPATCIVWQEGFKNGQEWIHYIGEVFLKNSNIYEVCNELRDRYLNAHFRVTGDASGRSRHHTTKGHVNAYTIIKQELQLKDVQFRLPGSNPPVSESRTLCNAMFAHHPELKYHPENCKNLIEDLRFTQVKDNGEIDTGQNMYRGHLLDADRYSKNAFHQNFIKKHRS